MPIHFLVFLHFLLWETKEHDKPMLNKANVKTSFTDFSEI